jgi:hypothetical protein
MTDLRAIVVAVDYDELALTLPYNRHHFLEVMVVTAPGDKAIQVADANRARVFVTDLFYANGAKFNKWRALEAGWDVFGRHGWCCHLDADVFWPKEAQLPQLEVGTLYGPLRRMMPLMAKPTEPFRLPPEDEWHNFPIHNNVHEWAGYSQIFHADDPHLGKPPWHEVDYTHAGAADSWFQARWGPADGNWQPGQRQPGACKMRLPFEVLHVGEAGANWFGRSTARLDGTQHPESVARRSRNRAIWNQRRARRNRGEDPYQDEKIQGG